MKRTVVVKADVILRLVLPEGMTVEQAMKLLTLEAWSYAKDSFHAEQITVESYREEKEGA